MKARKPRRQTNSIATPKALSLLLGFWGWTFARLVGGSAWTDLTHLGTMPGRGGNSCNTRGP